MALTVFHAPLTAEDEWRHLVDSVTPDSRQLVYDTVCEHASELAKHFYAYMMDHAMAKAFINHEVVHQRLHGSMMLWLKKVFEHPMKDASAIVAQQRHVGEVHARIQVPVHLVARGARLIKLDLNQAILARCTSTMQYEQCASHVNQTLDFALELMSASYERSAQRNAREDEAYRMYSVGQNIAVERERQRAILLEWGQELLFTLHRAKGAVPLPSLGKSEFGLWFTHKASVMFEGDKDMEHIRTAIERVDNTLMPVLRAPEAALRPREVLIQELQSELGDLKFHLNILFERHLETENGRDSLTRLLNRRFLPTVMNREIHMAQTRSTTFALMLLDLDHFKRVNDEYGHDAGDLVLQQAATLLLGSVRNGDFVFRYGGEELLVMLVEVSTEAAQRIAEQIRSRFESTPLQIGQGRTITVTASIGVSMYNGHPDYQYLIRRSDDAMYRAKNAGRNRVEFDSP